MKKILLLFMVFSFCFSTFACSDSDSDNDLRANNFSDDDSDSDNDFDSGEESDKGKFPKFSKSMAKEASKEAFKTSVEAMGELAKEGQESADKRLAALQKTYNENKVQVNKTITTDCANIKFKSYAILDQTFGSKTEKVIVMTFDYTNTDDYEWHFGTVLSEAYQGGVYIPRALHSLEKDTITSIRNGTTLEVVTSYTLRNESDSIELIFENQDYDSREDREISYKFDIK